MLVSVLTPTRNRPAFLARTITMFLAQDWPLKELLIIGRREDIGGIAISDPQMRFIEFDGTLGAALNEGIRHAKGEICVRFDDDDWQNVERISLQIGHMQATQRAVVGTGSFLLYAEGREYGWRVYDRLQHSAGAALAFTKEFADAHPFLEGQGEAEDSHFVTQAIKADEYSGITGLDILVMSCHGATSSGREDPEVAQWGGAKMLEASDNFYKIPLERFQHIIDGAPLMADDPESCPHCGAKGQDLTSHGDERQHFVCVQGCEDSYWTIERVAA
jgi:hypothetical protein